MTIWVVIYLYNEGGISDDVRTFSTREKAYEYLKNELQTQLELDLSSHDECDRQYYLRRYTRALIELQNNYQHGGYLHAGGYFVYESKLDEYYKASE